MDPACNMVGTLGNHEFDEGRVELLRLLNGGNFADRAVPPDPYQGASFPYVSANVVDDATGEPCSAAGRQAGRRASRSRSSARC